MWPFNRDKTPPQEPRDEQSWRPGDIAECIEDDWCFGAPADAPVIGERRMVVQVDEGTCVQTGKVGIGLRFIGTAPNLAYNALQFRKIILTDNGADRKVEREKPKELTR